MHTHTHSRVFCGNHTAISQFLAQSFDLYTAGDMLSHQRHQIILSMYDKYLILMLWQMDSVININASQYVNNGSR